MAVLEDLESVRQLVRAQLLNLEQVDGATFLGHVEVPNGLLEISP